MEHAICIELQRARFGGNGNCVDVQKLAVVVPTETVSGNNLVPPISSSEKGGGEVECQVSAASLLSSQEKKLVQLRKHMLRPKCALEVHNHNVQD